MIQQALAAGVHGILFCNAESTEAARLMIEAARYPFAPRVDGLAQGTRGNGSQAYASRMWGVTAQEYLRIADPWPIDPDGELLFGLKIENPRADANVEASVRVPGISFAEWGPGDHGFFILGRPGTYQGGVGVEAMRAVRARVLSSHQGRQRQVPQFLQRGSQERQLCHRPDQGWHHDLHRRRLAGGGMSAAVHQAHRPVLRHWDHAPAFKMRGHASLR